MNGIFLSNFNTFYYIYDNLSGFKQEQPYLNTINSNPYLLTPIYIIRAMEGKTWGFELLSIWQPRKNLKIHTAYTFLDMSLKPKTGQSNIIRQFKNNDAPKHQFSVRSSFDLPWNIELDIWLRYVDDILGKYVDDYTELDVGFCYKPKDYVSFTLVGQNLLNTSHAEFEEEYLWALQTKVQRGVYGKITLEF